MPPLRRALCRGENVLDRFLSPDDYSSFMSDPDFQCESNEYLLTSQVKACVLYFNVFLHLVHYFETIQNIPPGSEAKIRQYITVCSSHSTLKMTEYLFSLQDIVSGTITPEGIRSAMEINSLMGMRVRIPPFFTATRPTLASLWHNGQLHIAGLDDFGQSLVLLQQPLQ